MTMTLSGKLVQITCANWHILTNTRNIVQLFQTSTFWKKNPFDFDSKKNLGVLVNNKKPMFLPSAETGIFCQRASSSARKRFATPCQKKLGPRSSSLWDAGTCHPLKKDTTLGQPGQPRSQPASKLQLAIKELKNWDEIKEQIQVSWMPVAFLRDRWHDTLLQVAGIIVSVLVHHGSWQEGGLSRDSYW